jgi:hypothetical protein
MTPGGSQRPEPGELLRLVLDERHTVADLFAGYTIPEDEAGGILRDAVDALIQQCHRTERPRRLFLRLLEDGCAAHMEARAQAEAREAEEGDDDE